MSAIRLATAANVRAFQTLSQALDKSDNKWADSIDHDALEDETGRFRVWSGNLGALQKGHSSLDYRLRDSPLLSSNALKFLKELEDNLNEANAVVSGERLPYEQQAKAVGTQDEDDEDDDFFDDDEDEDEDEDDESSKSMRTELSMRFAEIVDIIDNLYKLSVRIRTPTIRSRSLKAATYHPKDPETGVDLLGVYAGYDVQHIKELLEELRREQANKTEAGTRTDKDDDSSYDYLIMRLSAAITSRRRQFKYWKRHRDKLGVSTILEDKLPTLEPQSRPEPQRNDTLDVLPELPTLATPKEAQSQRTGRTMLSGTEATQHHQSLDEIVDTKSVTSYAVTVKDIHGKGIELPPPPKAADGERDFECPYCYIICPARYGRGRAWKTHLLQDLQPYVCTYPECESAEQLFRSRREWAAHEATHRKAWRCPEHPSAIFKTQGGLEDHLRREHADSFPESQLPAIVKVGETSMVDTRPKCPICLAPPDSEGLGDFHNHIANHLERIATFALPTGTEDDDDGGSSVASRGRSDSMDSRNVDDLSLPTDESISVDNEVRKAKSPVEPAATDIVSTDQDVQPNKDQRSLLSIANLDQIPDGTQGRIDTLFTSVPEVATTGGVDGDKDDASPTDTSTDQETQRRGNLTAYLQSLPGFANITYSTPPGSGIWTGKAVFESEDMATNALSVFDEKLFPLIRIQQNETSREMISIMSIKGHPNLEMSENQQSLDDSDILEGTAYVPVEPEFYAPDENDKKEPVLEMSDIPTLRSMYRSRLLLQRDQSFLPNDSYNQMISFCHYDLTKIKVDAIVNSANKRLRPTSGETLNNTIFRAAGPDLEAETKSYGKLVSEAVLTPGYKLPCTNIIHVLRPGYHNYPNTSGQFNQLKDCYRNALRVAVKNGLKSIAFPCLGTGGVGVPPKVAARIALQEVRDYLDAPPEYKFERIIFCVNSAVDENAYVSLLPAYFPPTFDDVDIARSSVWLQDRGALAVKILEARTEVQKVFRELDMRMSKTVPGFPREILAELVAIDSCLASIRKHLLWKQDASGSMSDLKLACSVMTSLCGNMTETIDLVRDLNNTESRTDESVWDDYNSDWRARHGTDVAGFLQCCRDFIECLDDMITRNGQEIAELGQIRVQLDTYKSRRREPGGKGVDNRLSAFDEVLYLREYQREAAESSSIGEIVKVSQVQSVSQLYKLGELEQKHTLAHPSAIFNHTVCFVRENITKLQVDILVNSTDVTFGGMGTLDHSVFSKAGPEMSAAIKAYAGKCSEGDVKVTPGYALPAKSVLHVVPPRQYRQDTKRILREMYRQILHTAVSMRATSIAIPSIGTGMLNYPRNDTVSLALEEIKRFLEIAEPSSLLEKIIIVVYSSNDEHVYKNWIPVYFPPIDINVNRALPASQPVPVEDLDSSGPPRRKLYDSVGEAIRSVRFDQPAVPWRRINSSEEGTLISFESHADSCDTCRDPKRVYLEDQELCERGYSLAQKVLKHMNMREDHKVYSKPDDRGRVHELEVPGEQFPLSTKLLDTVERSFRDGKHDQPFVSPNRPYRHVNPQNKEASSVADSNTTSVMKEFEAFRAHVSINHDSESATIISSKLLMIRVYGDHVKIIDPTMSSEGQPQRLSFSFYTSTKLKRHKTTPEIVVRNPNILQSVSEVHGGSILLRCTSDMSCSLLLRKLRDVKKRSVGDEESEDSEGGEKDKKGEDSSLSDAGEESKSTSSRQQTSPQEYKAATKRLQNFLDELSSNRKASGGLSDLQFKIDRLNKAASSLQPVVPPAEEALSPQHEDVETKEPVIEAISALLLEFLAQDLKNRPGSYIGTKFDDIVSASRMRPGVVNLALQDLNSKGLIHNTVDDKTWVISDPPEGLSVLPTEATSAASRATATSSKPAKRTLSRTALWILSNIPYNVWSSTEAGVHRHISLKSQLSLSEIERALWEISQKTKWYPNKAEVTTFAETLIAGNPIETSNSWTYIDKNIVDPRILRASNVQFQEFENSIVLHRTLKIGELLDWAERSTEIRQSQGTHVEAVTKSKSAQAGTIEERSQSQASHSKHDPQLCLFVLEKDSVDAEWENVWPRKQRLPPQDLQQYLTLMRMNTRSIKDTLDAINSPIIQRLISKLVDDETQKLWDIDRTLQWKLSSIDVDWEAGHGARQVRRVSVMLETEPSGFTPWNPAALFGTQSTKDDTLTQEPAIDENPAEPLPAIEEPPIEPRPARSTQDEAPLSTLASTIHGFLVLNHKQSYEIDDLATGFGFSHVAMAAAISELSGRHMVHEVENNEWAVTLPGDDEAAGGEDDEDGDAFSSANLGPTASKIMEHMLHTSLDSYSATSLSESLNLSQEEMHLALIELSTQDLVRHVTGDFWALTNTDTIAKGKAKRASLNVPLDLVPQVRDAKSFTNTPPSPTGAPAQPAASTLELADINLDNFASYVSPSGARWTRLDKRTVDPKVLVDADEEFHEADDGLILHRVVRRGEIERWADLSVEVRRKTGEEGQERRGERGGRMDRKGKGKERDDAQGRLDRVLAGDMKEEELRYFAGDGSEERYI